MDFTFTVDSSLHTTLSEVKVGQVFKFYHELENNPFNLMTVDTSANKCGLNLRSFTIWYYKDWDPQSGVVIFGTISKPKIVF